MASILVLDDSASMRQMIKTALMDKGHAIVGAANGVQGLKFVKSSAFDLVITFVRELRKLPDYRGLPVVFVSTESRDSVKQQAKAAGATGWVMKPFSADQLCRVVDKVLAV
jgi:two-component system, chemotaxis family, chemotaxis protein CheY